MIIGFVWQGSGNEKVFNHWNDGLRMAMKRIEQWHTVKYLEPWHDLTDCDVLLYWEAPCTAKGENAEYYNNVRKADKPKILLFAGGPVDLLDAAGFDMYLVESEINEQDFERLELPYKRAFGVNEQVFKPMNLERKYLGSHFATFAEWKRHKLFAQALGRDGAVGGRLQENDRDGYYTCIESGVKMLGELEYEDVAKAMNESFAVVNTSSFWGGGQRETLEAMACGVPVIVMSDSPKNIEYVEESGAGLVCDPTKEAIQDALSKVNTVKPIGRKYIESKWTSLHYADKILEAINQVL